MNVYVMASFNVLTPGEARGSVFGFSTVPPGMWFRIFWDEEMAELREVTSAAVLPRSVIFRV